MARVSRVGRDEGMATVEAAFAIAAIVSVLVFGLGAVLGVATHVRAVDAAREVARIAAQNDSTTDEVGTGRGSAAAVEAGRSVAPAGASISVSTDGDRVRARVRVTSPLLPGVDLGSTAVAQREPTVDGVDG